jgi:mono/diheme cytochrome c family protein
MMFSRPSAYSRPACTRAVLFAALALTCCQRSASPDELARGRALFEERCASCHGVAGRGDGIVAAGLRPRPRAIAERAWQRATSDERIRSVIVRGGAAHGLSASMPPHPDLSDDRVRQLVAHIRSLSAEGRSP